MNLPKGWTHNADTGIFDGPQEAEVWTDAAGLHVQWTEDPSYGSGGYEPQAHAFAIPTEVVHAAMGASIQPAPSSPVDRWLAASAELPVALRTVMPEDLAAWLEARGWTPIEDAPGDWMSPDGLHEITLPRHTRDRTVRTWQALEDIGRWVAGVSP